MRLELAAWMFAVAMLIGATKVLLEVNSRPSKLLTVVVFTCSFWAAANVIDCIIRMAKS